MRILVRGAPFLAEWGTSNKEEFLRIEGVKYSLLRNTLWELPCLSLAAEFMLFVLCFGSEPGFRL